MCVCCGEGGGGSDVGEVGEERQVSADNTRTHTHYNFIMRIRLYSVVHNLSYTKVKATRLRELISITNMTSQTNENRCVLFMVSPRWKIRLFCLIGSHWRQCKLYNRQQVTRTRSPLLNYSPSQTSDGAQFLLLMFLFPFLSLTLSPEFGSI